MDVLKRIYERSVADVSYRKQKVSISDLRTFPVYELPRKSLYQALRRIHSDTQVRIIAEVKRASPSAGVIREDFDAVTIARDYIESGAAAISVLTDVPFFQGKLEYLGQISHISPIPVLRKDFIHDHYQIEEARAYGADAILLIATMLSATQLSELHQSANELGLDCLVECYDEHDADKISFEQIRIFGVNNRDLRTFKVDVSAGINLLNKVPDHVVKVSESGISLPSHMKKLHDEQIDAALIGESLMRADKPGKALKTLLNYRSDVS